MKQAMKQALRIKLEAILHNEEVIASSDKKGLSIERETFLLKVISKELVS